jgi:alkylation response protein AidB-like acyl-CoA dehydrogenase
VDFHYPAELDEFRAEVRRALAEELPEGFIGVGGIADRTAAETFVREFRDALVRRGLFAVTWPVEYGGRGLSRLHQVVLVDELARAGLPYGVATDTYSVKMLANTLLVWGTEKQKRYFLPRIRSMEHVWCQGYSEPGSGSDLASLSTRARLDGSEWVIDGQKVWTSSADRANWIFVLARTDPDAPRHSGISFLLVPLDQPGIEVRPIRMINGDAEFAEVFFTGARTRADLVVGPVNAGWKVAQTLLGYERGDEAATLPLLFRAELDRLIGLVRERGLHDDPLIRQELVKCFSSVEVMRFLGYRVLTGLISEKAPGPEASVFKLIWSEYHQRVTDLAMNVLGLPGIVPEGRGPLRVYRTDDPGAPNSTGSWSHVFLNARAGTIYAGTSQVQRNILGEGVLGLPREPRPTGSSRG